MGIRFLVEPQKRREIPSEFIFTLCCKRLQQRNQQRIKKQNTGAGRARPPNLPAYAPEKRRQKPARNPPAAPHADHRNQHKNQGEKHYETHCILCYGCRYGFEPCRLRRRSFRLRFHQHLYPRCFLCSSCRRRRNSDRLPAGHHRQHLRPGSVRPEGRTGCC